MKYAASIGVADTLAGNKSFAIHWSRLIDAETMDEAVEKARAYAVILVRDAIKQNQIIYGVFTHVSVHLTDADDNYHYEFLQRGENRVPIS